MSNQSTKNNDMNDDGMLNAETQRKLPQGEILQPKLRFKGFTDPWQQRKLEELLIPAKAKNVEGKFTKNDVLSVSGEFGIVNQIALKGKSSASESVLPYSVVNWGDAVYTKSPLKEAPYGIIKVNQGRAGIVSTLYAVYTLRQHLIIPVFLELYFDSSVRLNNYLKPLVNKGAKNDMKVKNVDVLKGHIHITPNVVEQARIAEFFRVLDDLIAAAKKKADLLKLKKRYYLQAIFSQQLRFKGFTEPWQQRKLGELLSVRKETTTTPTLYHIDIELENLQEDGGLVGDATVRTNSTSVFRRGDVLFGRLRPYLRKWWLATESGIRSGEIWAIYSPSRVLISSFVYALVQSPIFLQVALITSGTKMPRSDWENIASEAGSLPCSNDEQARIGDFFNKLDNLIAASCRKIELLERCKDAYLHLLFI